MYLDDNNDWQLKDDEYLITLEKAFSDIMDGQDDDDIRRMTGLPKERCQEIYNFYTKQVLSSFNKNRRTKE
jgi:hypothetical protein